MYKLLTMFLKYKYDIDDEQVNSLIGKAVRDNSIKEWYKIAVVSFEEEMLKDCK